MHFYALPESRRKIEHCSLDFLFPYLGIIFSLRGKKFSPSMEIIFSSVRKNRTPFWGLHTYALYLNKHSCRIRFSNLATVSQEMSRCSLFWRNKQENNELSGWGICETPHLYLTHTSLRKSFIQKCWVIQNFFVPLQCSFTACFYFEVP